MTYNSIIFTFFYIFYNLFFKKTINFFTILKNIYILHYECDFYIITTFIKKILTYFDYTSLLLFLLRFFYCSKQTT